MLPWRRHSSGPSDRQCCREVLERVQVFEDGFRVFETFVSASESVLFGFGTQALTPDNWTMPSLARARVNSPSAPLGRPPS